MQFIAQEGYFPNIILEGKMSLKISAQKRWVMQPLSSPLYPPYALSLLNRQRIFREPPGLVADGRDMGTVVFPDAEYKFFLLATAEERAQRRHNQLMERGINVNLGDLIAELYLRDKRDQERTIAPLKPADDAVCIDTDHLTIEEVVEKILSELEGKDGKKAFPATSNLMGLNYPDLK